MPKLMYMKSLAASISPHIATEMKNLMYRTLKKLMSIKASVNKNETLRLTLGVPYEELRDQLRVIATNVDPNQC